jgi:hypothetical protein
MRGIARRLDQHARKVKLRQRAGRDQRLAGGNHAGEHGREDVGKVRSHMGFRAFRGRAA